MDPVPSHPAHGNIPCDRDDERVRAFGADPKRTPGLAPGSGLAAASSLAAAAGLAAAAALAVAQERAGTQ